MDCHCKTMMLEGSNAYHLSLPLMRTLRGKQPTQISNFSINESHLEAWMILITIPFQRHHFRGANEMIHIFLHVSKPVAIIEKLLGMSAQRHFLGFSHFEFPASFEKGSSSMSRQKHRKRTAQPRSAGMAFNSRFFPPCCDANEQEWSSSFDLS